MSSTDPAVRTEAASVLTNVFAGIGQHASGQGIDSLGLGGLATQVEQFANLPVDLATIFVEMSGKLTELILTSLEQAGIALVRDLTPL